LGRLNNILGVLMQSNLKFDRYITLQKDKASKILGAIKNALHEAPREGKTLSLLEMLQHRAVRFIAGLKR